MTITREKPTLSLGTANFGMAYGLGGSGKLAEVSQVKQILKAAISEGFSHLDTATAYKNSEKILGDLLQDGSNFRVTTKLKSSECSDAKTIIQAVRDSLQRSKQTKYWSVLLHDSKVLLEGNSKEVQSGLREIVDCGLTERVGISGYDESEIVQAKSMASFLSVFQVPDNVCDQRLRESSQLSTLALEDNLIFVRSIFLQGLLLMDPLSLPPKVASGSTGLRKLKAFCDEHGISILDLCIGYAKSLPWVSGLIFGADSEKQIHEISKSFNSTINVDYSIAPKLDSFLLDPRNWS